MINLKTLHNLDKHIDYLNPKIWKDNIFIVGWSVRDLLIWISQDPLDIDITTDWDPKILFNNINKDWISIFMTEKFWTITLIPKEEEIKKLFNKMPSWDKALQYELTPLRLEWKYQDFRHPQEIQWTDNLLSDSKRRDFTINCIYYYSTKHKTNSEDLWEINEEKIIKILEKEWYIYIKDANILILQDHNTITKLLSDKELLNELTKQWYTTSQTQSDTNLWIVIDPHKWIQDIIQKKLKCVWEADDRFQEDALRIIRAVRLLNILNQKIKWKENMYFDYEKNTWNSMKLNYYLVQFIAKERIKDEIMKAFKWNNPFGFIALLDELNILKYLFPALYNTKKVDQPVRYHPFDVYTHTMLCLDSIQRINTNYLVKLAILYHDVGKPDQYYFVLSSFSEESRKKVHWSFIHHPTLWEDLVNKDFRSLGFSNKEIDEIAFYVKNHMLPWELMNANPENLPKKLKRLLSNQWFERINNLIDVTIADRMWHYNPLQPTAIDWVEEMRTLLKKIYDEFGEFKLKDLAINWNDIINELKIPAWPIIWALLEKALERAIDDIKERNNKEKLFEHIKALYNQEKFRENYK